MFPKERSLYVRGWALNSKELELVSEVRIVVDESLEIQAAYGHARGDIATTFGSADLSRCGFEATIPPVLAPGDHGIAVVAISANGKECYRVASLTVHVIETLIPRAFDYEIDDWALGYLEHFANDHENRLEHELTRRIEIQAGGGCVVSGWAYDQKGGSPLVEVGALFDKRWYVQGRPGIERKDVSAAHGLASLPGWGFVIRFVMNFAEPGFHSIQIVGRTALGSWLFVGEPTPFEVVHAPLPWIWALTELREPTRWQLDTVDFYSRTTFDDAYGLADPLPAEPHGAMYLTGWAIDRPAGAPASALYMSLDGDRLHPVPARYGLPTPELPATLGHGPWAACGFTALVPTKHLEPGVHTLEALIVSSNGSCYYVVDVLRFFIPDPENRSARDLARPPVLVSIDASNGVRRKNHNA